MSLMDPTIMGVLPHDCSDASEFGRAVAILLRARYPVSTAKMVAQDLSRLGSECTLKTAENILAGKLSGRSITRLTLAYGLGFLIDAGAQVTGQSLQAYIENQAAQAREESARWEALLNKAGNGTADERRMAPPDLAGPEGMVGELS